MDEDGCLFRLQEVMRLSQALSGGGYASNIYPYSLIIQYFANFIVGGKQVRNIVCLQINSSDYVEKIRLLDVSCGFNDEFNRGSQEVDDADKSCIRPVPPSPHLGCLENTIERFNANVAVS